jgi:hypothetical protein
MHIHFFPCHSQFDYEVSINFYMSYFHYDRENDTHSSKSNRNVKEFENNFLIFCIYLNLVKHQIIILYQIENSQVVAILKFCTGFWRIFFFFIDPCMNRDIFLTLKFVSDLWQVGDFLLSIPVFSTNKTDCHDIAEILLKVPLNTKPPFTLKGNNSYRDLLQCIILESSWNGNVQMFYCILIYWLWTH